MGLEMIKLKKLIIKEEVDRNKLKSALSDAIDATDKLSKAVNITSDKKEEEKKFFEGIIQFGQTDVKQIMKARIDIIALEIKTPFEKVIITAKSNNVKI